MPRDHSSVASGYRSEARTTTPTPRPSRLLTTKRHLTEQEAEELKARWLKAMESPRIEVLHDPPTDTKWIKFEPVRRPWWKRRTA